MKKILLLALWALLPISMSAQLSIYTDGNGLKWIKNGSDYYILISESATATIGGTTYTAESFIPDAKFRAFIRTTLGTGSQNMVYRDAKTGYKDFASITGTYQTDDTKAFTYSGGLTITAQGIQEFTGIGYFHALKVLAIQPQGIEGTFNLDVTKNKSLVYLQAIDTEMKELDAHGLTSLTWLDLAPSSRAVSPDTKLEVININDCSNLRGSAYYYGNKTSRLGAGTRANNNLYLTYSENNYRYCHIKKVYARNCSKITQIYCQQSLLEELDLTGCTNLAYISADHGMLTSDKIYLHGCQSLINFIMKRHKFTDLDFLLKPSTRNGVSRTAEDIAKLVNVQVNGGSYYIAKATSGDDNSDIVGYREDASGNPIYVTTAIREVDLSYLSPEVFRQLNIANNLLTRLDLSRVEENLRTLECDGNLLATLDLAGLNIKDYKFGTADTIRTITATNQFIFADAEVVKGAAEDGSKDWVAVHFDGYNTVYSMDFPDGLDIYENRWRSEKAADKKLRHEPDAWMCTVSETQTGAAASKFNSAMTCPEGSDERHLFLLSKTELGDMDLDLNGRVINYTYNTRYNQDIDPATQAPELNADGSLKLKNTRITTREGNRVNKDGSSNIQVHMQTHSYILNINPKTKVGSGVDYYSGTLCLDYDALIPDGVTVYFISADSVQTQNVIYENGEKIIEQQFKMVPFGGDGRTNKILPANTPVYVMAKTNAGLYAFKPITKYNLQGWQQQRGQNIESTVNILYGMEPTDLEVKDEYVTALADAKAAKDTLTNLLCGYMGKKYIDYPEFYELADSTHKEFYNIDKVTVMDTIPRTILTLGREARSGKIGFWPYGGTTLPAHRCYIKATDFIAAGGLPVSSGAKGGASFLFDFNEATGIQVVERNEPKAVAEDEWYTLQGVKLSGRPLRRGVYIHNGKKEQIQ